MKTNKGGKRVGSGRKKSPYQTKTIAFRVEFVEPIKKIEARTLFVSNF